MWPHRRFAHCSCKNAALNLDLGLSASAAGSCCIFTLAVRQPPVLASYIEIYYFIKFFVVRNPRRKCDFGGSLTHIEVKDSSIDDVIVKKTRFRPLVGKVNKRNVVNVKEVTKKEVAVDSSAVEHELWQRTDIT